MRILIFAASIVCTLSKSLPSVRWQSNSPPIERLAAIGDTLDIFCPSYSEDTNASETEQSIIYRVSESDYNSCKLGETAKELGRCTSPYKQDKIKVAFRLFSPNPSALEYRPATTYYFISTSNGTKEGLHQREGGLCSQQNMKMIIRIANGRHHHRHTSTTTPAPTNSAEWNSDPLIAQVIEKISKDAQFPLNALSRAERLNLPEAEFLTLSIPSDESMQYQIHELGEAESWSTEPSSGSHNSFMLLCTILLFRYLY